MLWGGNVGYNEETRTNGLSWTRWECYDGCVRSNTQRQYQERTHRNNESDTRFQICDGDMMRTKNTYWENEYTREKEERPTENKMERRACQRDLKSTGLRADVRNDETIWGVMVVVILIWCVQTKNTYMSKMLRMDILPWRPAYQGKGREADWKQDGKTRVPTRLEKYRTESGWGDGKGDVEKEDISHTSDHTRWERQGKRRKNISEWSMFRQWLPCNWY